MFKEASHGSEASKLHPILNWHSVWNSVHCTSDDILDPSKCALYTTHALGCNGMKSNLEDSPQVTYNNYSLVVTAVKAYKARVIALQEVHCIPMCR